MADSLFANVPKVPRRVGEIPIPRQKPISLAPPVTPGPETPPVSTAPPAPAVRSTPSIFENVPKIDRSSVWGDVKFGWNQLKSALAANRLADNQTELDRMNVPMPVRTGRLTTELRPRSEADRQRFIQNQKSAIADMISTGQIMAATKTSPAAAKFSNAKSFTEGWNTFWENPYAVSRTLTLQSGASSLPSVVGGIVGNILGPTGSAIGAGVGSYTVELGGAISDGLQQFGAKMDDPVSIYNTWNKNKDAIMAAAHKRALFVGGVDALTAGVASKVAAVPGLGKLKKEIIGTAVDAVGGGTGETLAELNEGTGELKPGQILSEVVGEVVPGGLQVAGQQGVHAVKQAINVPVTETPKEQPRVDPQLQTTPPVAGTPVVTATPPVAGAPPAGPAAPPPLGQAPAPQTFSPPQAGAGLPPVNLPPTPPGWVGPTENPVETITAATQPAPMAPPVATGAPMAPPVTASPPMAPPVSAAPPVAPPGTGSPQPAAPGSVASVPFMTTNAHRLELAKRGFTKEQIKNLKPEQVQQILAEPAQPELPQQPQPEATAKPAAPALGQAPLAPPRKGVRPDSLFKDVPKAGTAPKAPPRVVNGQTPPVPVPAAAPAIGEAPAAPPPERQLAPKKAELAPTIPEKVEPPAPAASSAVPEGGSLTPEKTAANLPPPVPGAPAAQNQPQVDENGSYLQQFTPDQLTVDPKTMQYKSGADEKGVTGSLRGPKIKWNNALSDKMLIWLKKDGTHVVVNGHQRFDLAKRAQAAGQNPVLDARVYREEDGFTAQKMMVMGALANMADGHGTSVDAAKILRDNPNAADELQQNAVVRDAKGLAKLSDDAFGMVVNEKVPATYAAIVGEKAPDKATHAQILDVLAKNKPSSKLEAESMISDVLEAPAVQANMEDLFGTKETTQILFKERARVLSSAVAAIKADRKAFSVLVKEKVRIAEGGNVLATDKNMQREQEDAQLLANLQASAQRKGPIADALNLAAKRLHDGENSRAVVNGFLRALRNGSETSQESAANLPERQPVKAPATPQVKPPVAEKPAPQPAPEKKVVAEKPVAAPEPAPAPPKDTVGQEPAPPAAESTPKPQETSGGVMGNYGESNKGITKSAADEIRAKLKAKMDGTQLGAGLDPEILLLGAQLAAYHVEAGVRKFADFAAKMAADLGTTIEKIRPYLRAWYNGARDHLDDLNIDTSQMDSLDQVKAAFKDLKDVPSGSDLLEPNSGAAAPQNGLGQADIPATPGRNEPGTGEGGGTDNQGNGSVGVSSSLPQGDALILGENGNLELPERQPEFTFSDTPPGDYSGSADSSQQGLPDDSIPIEEAIDHARTSASIADRKRAQVAAQNVAVKAADRANIAQSLPLLFPEQQDDVYKIETRFAKPKGHGMLITNGTGTGKTFSGLGVIKRFFEQGKRNILVLAPSQPILSDWVLAAKNLLLEVRVLPDTNSHGGNGLTATTYANMGSNDTLADRKWDLIVADESHNLSANQAGDPTKPLTTLRAITFHPDGMADRARMIFRREWQRVLSAPTDSKERTDAYRAFQDKAQPAIAEWRKEDRTSRVLMLSATPFPHHFSLDMAEGYLFEHDRSQTGAAYNSGNGRNQYYIKNLGYKMKTNRLTKPDAGVNMDVMEQQLHENMKKDGALAGRALEVEKDYDRKFLLTPNAVGSKISEALDLLSNSEDGKYMHLGMLIREKFDYLSRRRLLEAIKAKEVIPYINKSLALNRKVVVFHDYNQGGGTSPFKLELSPETLVPSWQPDGKSKLVYAKPLYEQFLAKNPWVNDLDFAEFPSPIVALKNAFPQALIYNGTVSGKARTAIKEAFNDDNSGKDIIIVQSAAGQAGISLHDTTGVKPRVLYNLGMPAQPMTTLQEEGRIYRVGQMSDAMFRYLTTGSTWDRWTFAQTIAQRSGTVENLALGDQARTIRQSIVDAFNDADSYEPHVGEGTGGKELDRSTNQGVSEFEKAKTYYFAQGKNNKSRNQREGKDYYATPEPLGLKMVEWANIHAGDKVLEPSAGHGAISRFFPDDSHQTLIEPSDSLASKASLSSPGARVIVDDFESLNVTNKYDAIIMNPPFGVAGKTAIDHLGKAMLHVKNGGRIVALIPQGAATQKFVELMRSPAAASFRPVGRILLPTVTFERAGTSISAEVVVLEKHNEAITRVPDAGEATLAGADTIGKFFDQLELMEMPDRTPPLTKEIEAGHGAKLNVGGIDFSFQDNGETHFYASLDGKIDIKKFNLLKKWAMNHDGYYYPSLRGWQFPNAQSRQDFLSTVASPPVETKAAIAPDGAIVGTKFTTTDKRHTKTGLPIFNAKFTDVVDRSVYLATLEVVKANNGFYSPFDKAFQFKSAADRTKFLIAMAPQDKPGMQLSIEPSAPVPLNPVDRKKAQAELQAIVDNMVGAGRVKVQTVLDIMNGKDEARGTSKTAGGFSAWKNLIIISAAHPDIQKTLYHEVLHAMRKLGLIEKDEWRMMVADAKKWTVDGVPMIETLKKRYAEAYKGLILTPAQREDLMEEELVAVVFSERAATFTPRKGVAKIITKIKAFMEQLSNWSKGYGFVPNKPETAADVMRAMQSGAFAGRPVDEGKNSGYRIRSPRQSIKDEPQLSFPVEPGAEGLPQMIIPGTEKITEKERLQRLADAKLKPKAAQKPMEEGLFGDESKQGMLFAITPRGTHVTVLDPAYLAESELHRDKLRELAGNIRLSKLDTTDSIKHMLIEVADAARGFIEERRGVQTHAQTIALSELIGSDRIEGRIRGEAFNSPEIFAGRTLLLKSIQRVQELSDILQTSTDVTDLLEFKKAFLRNAAIQEQVAGFTAEAGRALNILKKLARDDYYQAATSIMGVAKKKPGVIDWLSGESGPSIIGNDESDIKEVARMFHELGNPAFIAKTTAQAYKATKMDMLRELWLNFLLSGPQTHVTNILSNAVTAFWQVPETALAAMIGKLHGGDKVYLREATARLSGLMHGTAEGLQSARIAFKTEEPADAVSRLEVHRRRAIPGRLGKSIRVSTRLLLAEDEVFKAVNYRAEIGALAVRIAIKEKAPNIAARAAYLRANPTRAMRDLAHKSALYHTFQTQLGPIASLVVRLRDKIPFGYVALAFIKTPVNLFKFAGERTPFGLLSRKVRANLSGKAGNVARDTQTARIMLATGIALYLASYVAQGLISGSGPDDKEEREVKRATGWQPYSVKIADKWYNYQRFDPFSLIVGITADYVETSNAIKEEGAFNAKVGAMIVTAISQNVLNKTWMKGPADMLDALRDPSRYGERYIQQMIGTIIPSGVNQWARVQDPVLRDARTIVDTLKSRIPGMSQTLAPRIDIFGEPIVREGSLGPDIASSIYVSTQKDNPLAQEMVRLHYFPSAPQREINGHPLNSAQYAEYSQLAGQRAVQRLRTAGSPAWQERNDDFNVKSIKKQYDDARDWARIQMKEKYPELKLKVAPQ